MSSSAFMDNLRQLFAECDRDQSGSLGPDEFKELCAKIGLSRDMADETFKRLDIDQDSQITFDEFAAGFKQYKDQQQQQAKPNGAGQTQGGSRTPPRFTQSRPASSPVTRRARSRTSTGANGANSLGSTGSSGNLASGRSTSSSGANEAASRCFSSTDLSCDQDQRQQQAADDVIVYTSDQLLADQSCSSGQFGSMMSSNGSLSQLRTMQDLLECVQKLQNENQILTQIFFKDKREREEYISQLGEEFDQQLREVEERANRRAREELELEKRRLKDMMQSERETLQHHYQTLEKISKMVKSSASSGKPLDGEGFSKVKSQLEDTFVENRQLKKSLMDTKTDVAMIWKEMEKLKKHYEDKLSNAYEKQRETQHECDHIKLQLNLMKDSNRKLQDASDVITNYIADKVEPVIKVALDSNDDSNDQSSLNPIQQQRSASNSRRGSILSEYLIDNDRDDIDDDAIESSISLGSNLGGARLAAPNGEISAQTSVPRRNNGLEVSLSRNQRFNQSTTSTSTTASDSHFLNVTSPARAKIRAGEQPIDKGKPDEKFGPIGEQAKETITQIVPKLKEQVPAVNKLAGSGGVGSEQTQSRTSLKSIGRHFMLGSRSSSEAKPKESARDRSELKSLSADQADEPMIEPSDGPSVATFNIILVGDSFVGKSSFAARFIEGNFIQGLISNCSIDFKTKSYKVDGINYTVNLWDTAGQERFRSITASYFRKADGIILMYDVTDKRSYLNVRNWMSTIADTAAENVAVLLVGNKIDLRINDNKPNCVPTEEGFRLAREYNIVFLETSVKTGTNLLPSMGKLIRLIAKNNTPEDTDNDRIKLSDKARSFNCMPKNC